MFFTAVRWNPHSGQCPWTLITRPASLEYMIYKVFQIRLGRTHHIRQNSNSYSHTVADKLKTLIANSSSKTLSKSAEVIFGDKVSAALQYETWSQSASYKKEVLFTNPHNFCLCCSYYFGNQKYSDFKRISLFFRKRRQKKQA